ncbi:class I SAM-dependent methyltransferase [uncultured Porticoccus sp.]|uniref:class I SAM-dependent methyltransferase n=1 Tax=uncultured Porticoccus sp. TaxID=1256050 RepID=UPI00260C98E6|nr:class I SAM-dependent methyltransferase [uncultured Porticoccus sp.]
MTDRKDQLADTVAGTRGYEEVVDVFIEASQALNFAEICSDVLEFLPSIPCRVLDAGAGAGQNAAALSRMGYSVVAAEPLPAFLDAGRSTYGDLDISWVQDSLPHLQDLPDPSERFGFILLEGVWHHLDDEEREWSMARLSTLLIDGGICALSLRHGPAGAGKHVFPTDGPMTTVLARRYGMEVALHLADQPSKMSNKPGVTWTRMVFRKEPAGAGSDA